MKRSGKAGFTLVEIMIVVALIAVVAGMTAPTVAAGIKRYQLISAGQQVASTIRSARFQAVAKNRKMRVRFDCPAEGQYRIVEFVGDPVIDDADDRCETAAFPYPSDDGDPDTVPNFDGAVQYLPDGVEFGDTDDLEITTAGRMEAAGTIVVSNGDADQDRTITVSTNGQVQLN